MRRLSPQSPGGRACLCVFFFRLVCFFSSLFVCLVFNGTFKTGKMCPPALHSIYFIHTRYSLHVLKVPLNTNQSNKLEKNRPYKQKLKVIIAPSVKVLLIAAAVAARG